MTERDAGGVGEKLKEKLFDLRCLNLGTGQNPKPCHRIHHVSRTSANNIMRTKTYKEDKKPPGYNVIHKKRKQYTER